MLKYIFEVISLHCIFLFNPKEGHFHYFIKLSNNQQTKFNSISIVVVLHTRYTPTSTITLLFYIDTIKPQNI